MMNKKKKKKNLLTTIILRTSLLITLILSIWALFIFFAIINEVNDEIDDSLDLYSDYLIEQKKQGKEMIETHSNSNNMFLINPVSLEEAEQREKPRYRDTMIYLYEKKETEPARVLERYFIDKKEGNAYKIEIFTSTIEKKDLVETITWWLLTLFLILLVTIIIVYVWIYRSSMKPLYLLLNWLREYRLGKKNIALPQTSSIREFQELYMVITQSINSIEKAFEEQKDFIGNASHETQTPLAISINRLQNLLNHDMNKELAEEIIKTIHSLEHLTRLNKTLLLLTKIENKQFVEKEYISVENIIKRSLETFAEVYEYKGILTNIEVKNNLKISINKTIVEILINNLLKNAYVYNIQNGRIIVSIDYNRIIISNTSDSDSLDKDRIFHRFYKNNTNSSSIGLGLTLVKSICNKYNISILYTYYNSMHNFELIF